MLHRVKRLLFPVFVLFLFSTTVFAAGEVERAKALLDQGKAAQAYQLVEEIKARHEGTPQFDYVYGLAAIEAKHLDVALFAFERVLMLQPDHHLARIALARTYYQLDDHDGARQELLDLLKKDPPQSIVVKANALLAKIRQSRSQVSSFNNHFYLDLAAGADDNINRSASFFVYYPGATFFEPIKAYYLKALFGFYGDQAITHNVSWYWQVGTEHRDNLNQEYDSNSFHGLAGLAIHWNKFILRIPGYYQFFMLDGKTFRHVGFVSLELLRFLMDDRMQVGVFVDHGTVRYPPNRSPDVDTDVGGAFVTYFTPDRKTYVKVKAYATDSDSRTPDDFGSNKRYGNHGYGFEAIIKRQIMPRHLMVLRLMRQITSYKFITNYFGNKRHDDHTAFDAAWYWKARPAVMLGLHYNYTDNDSNQGLFDYDRQAVWVSMRYLFD